MPVRACMRTRVRRLACAPFAGHSVACHGSSPSDSISLVANNVAKLLFPLSTPSPGCHREGRFAITRSASACLG
eukprot:13947306-Alexandrium_andersonii.AAC.1